MRTAVVTGASTGIGRATALLLDARGWTVFAGYRDPADAEALRQAASPSLTPVPIELRDGSSIQAAADAVGAALGAESGLDALVNNAGLVIAGPLEFIPAEALREQFEVNVIGTISLTQRLLPHLRAARGRIIMVSSVNGRVATPFGGPYAASKFALEALADTWRVELRPWGIATSLVEPGAVATPIWDTTRQRAAALAADYPASARDLYGRVIAAIDRVRQPPRAIAPEHVADVILRALTSRHPRARYLVGRDARLGALLKSVLPTAWFDALLARRRR